MILLTSSITLTRRGRTHWLAIREISNERYLYNLSFFIYLIEQMAVVGGGGERSLQGNKVIIIAILHVMNTN